MLPVEIQQQGKEATDLQVRTLTMRELPTADKNMFSLPQKSRKVRPNIQLLTVGVCGEG